MRASGATVGLFLLSQSLIWAQLPLGPEFQVNPSHGAYDDVPSAGIASDGTGVVVYNGNAGLNKYLRFLDSTGLPHGALQRLNEILDEGFPEFQHLDLAPDGEGFACWNGDGARARCRKVFASGSLGTEQIEVSSRPYVYGEREGIPDVAVREDGSAVVVWLYNVDDPDTQVRNYYIEGRYLDPSGTPEGDVFRVATTLEPLTVVGVSVAVISPDRSLVSWNESGADGNGNGVKAQFVDRSGSLVGPAFIVNSFVAGDQQLPSVDADLQGRSVVVWESVGQDGSQTGIYGQRFDRDGARLGGEFQVTSNAPSDQTWPSVAVDSFGNFVVVYESFQESNELVQDSFIRAYRSDGTPRGDQVRANEQIIYEQTYPSVALSDTGLIQVAYQSWRSPTGDPMDYNFDIMTRRFVLPCEADATTLCLQGGRFQVRALWGDYQSRRGAGQAIDLTDDSGGFWFFAPGNLELLVKLVDGCGYNQRFWFFAAGLTDLDVELLVTDTWTGKVEIFENVLGIPFDPVQRIDLFATCGAEPLPSTSLATPVTLMSTNAVASPSGDPNGETCTPNETTLCLGSGRFRVRSQWSDFAGISGAGTAVPLAEDSGLFWFFEPENVELAVKVIDGCDFNNRYWVFAAGLTNVEVHLTVEDLLRQRSWSRATGLGEAFPAFLDSSAFSTCP